MTSVTARRAAGGRAAGIVALVAALLTACSASTTSSSRATTGPTSTGPLTGSITVLAASSLTNAFNQIGAAFKAAHPDLTVSFSFGGSATLVQQADAGAPADVLATADTATMQMAVAAGTVAAPATFAHNALEIIVGPGNPKGIQSLADLAKPGVVVVLCAADQPCGMYGSQALAKANVHLTPASLEPNVASIVTKVELGEADAGIVYVTDVKAAGDKAAGVAVPASQNVVADYPIAVFKHPQNGPLAAAFVAFVRSSTGQAALTQQGFST